MKKNLKKGRVSDSKDVYLLIIDQCDEGGWKVKIEYPDGTVVISENVYSDEELGEEYNLVLEEEFSG